MLESLTRRQYFVSIIKHPDYQEAKDNYLCMHTKKVVTDSPAQSSEKSSLGLEDPLLLALIKTKLSLVTNAI